MNARTLLHLVLALAAALGMSLVALPAKAADGIGERCESFRGAKRCAFWSLDGGSGDDQVPYATTTVNVNNGGDAEVKTAMMQRRTQSGWVTVARSNGSGVRGYYASDSAAVARCGDLKKGTYRSRGKVSWSSEGVRYKRWITGTPVKKRALC